jgi:hypothetical protein
MTTDIRVAHLILTYTNPQQTERMINRMYHPNFDFYIHVDKKMDIGSHLYLETLSNVYFIKNRVDVTWAGFSTVQATFECIKEICRSGIKYEFINFLSGQDYPIKPAEILYDFYTKNTDKDFLSYRDFTKEWKEGMLRIEKYYLTNYNFRGKNTLERLINLVLPKRKLPGKLIPYGKSMFWMLHPETALYVVNTVEQNKTLKRFFSLSWASDEFVFQTVILNSSYKKNVINNNYRYIDWSGGGANPKVFDVGDFASIASSGMLFARKFDLIEKPEILNLIDQQLLSNGAYSKPPDLQRQQGNINSFR